MSITTIALADRAVTIGDVAENGTVAISQRSGFSGRQLDHDIDPTTGSCATVGCDFDPLDAITSRIDAWTDSVGMGALIPWR